MPPRRSPSPPWQRVTVRLSPANYEWLREKAHLERKSQALALNEALDAAREADELLRLAASKYEEAQC